jgi:hypothetical protein
MEIYKIPYYTCGCGYKTSVHGNAAKHKKKVDCGHEMLTESKEFVLKSSVSNDAGERNILTEKNEALSSLVKEKDKVIEEKDKVIEEKDKVIERQLKSINRLANNQTDLDDEYAIGTGIIYYVTDTDVPSRGKIGRTKNTDVKKLKSRYSTFSKPRLFCFYSADIKKDENDLKTVLKDHGCMDATIGKETVNHCPETMRIFLEFVSSR